MDAEIYPISEDEIEEIIKLSRTNRRKIAEDVKIFEEWFMAQPHFPKEMPFEGALERGLANCFYRVELAKERAELYVSYKSKYYEEFFEPITREDFVLPSKNCGTLVPLPSLGPDYERIYVMYLKSPELDKFDFDQLLQLGIKCLEIGFKYEKTNRVTVVADCKGFNLEFLKRIDISKFIKFVTLLYEGYFTRIIGVHILNASPSIQFLVNMSKRVIPGKLFKMLHVHDNLDSLYDILPQKYLPEEYGGANGAICDILAAMRQRKIANQWISNRLFCGALEKMDVMFQENQDYFVKAKRYRSDDSKRPEQEAYTNTFGVDVFF